MSPSGTNEYIRGEGVRKGTEQWPEGGSRIREESGIQNTEYRIQNGRVPTGPCPYSEFLILYSSCSCAPRTTIAAFWPMRASPSLPRRSYRTLRRCRFEGRT